MKNIFIYLLCALYAFGMSEHELYKKALEFEKNGDDKNAMIFYKMAAQKSMNISSQPILQDMYQNSVDSSKLQTSSLKNDTQYVSNEISQEEDVFDKLGIKIYEPIYLIGAYDFKKRTGRDRGEIKFQLSFEKAIVSNLLDLDDTLSFAYTQTSWWQFWRESAPFRETNYRPEIFITIPAKYENINYFRFGVTHESNGRDGEESRSWNKIFAQTNFKFGNLEIVPRIWQGFKYDDENNGNINSYMGYGDLRINYDFKGHKLNALLRNNLRVNHDNRGALQVGWMFPLHNGIYGYLQYFTGYGESLIDYDKYMNKIGMGFAILK